VSSTLKAESLYSDEYSFTLLIWTGLCRPEDRLKSAHKAWVAGGW